MRSNKRLFLIILIVCSLEIIIGIVLFTRPQDYTASSIASQIIKDCNKASDFNNCVKSSIDDSEKKLSFVEMSEVISSLSVKDSRLSDCHELAHDVSEFYNQNGSSPISVDNLVDPYSCGGGFLHGIVASQLSKSQIIDGQDGVKICQKYAGQYQQVNCVHMLGHIGYYMFNDIKKTVAYCEQLADPMLIKHCYSGLFMEYTLGTVARSHDATVPVLQVNREYINNYEKICLGAVGQVRDSCYTEMARLYLSYYKMNPNQVFKACKNIQPLSSQESCQKYAALLIASNDSTKAGAQVCDNVELGMDRQKCRDTVGFGIVSNSYVNILRISDVCDNDLSKDLCVKNIVKRVHAAYGTQVSIEKCTKLNKQDILECLKIVTQV